MAKKRVAIIGTKGIPASYGGFETLAENLTKELSEKVDFLVYCSSIGIVERPEIHNNSKLVYVPLKANGWQSFIYDIICIIHSWFHTSTLLILGPVAGIILLPSKILGKRIVVNYGGLNEWEREKYSYITKRLLLLNYHIAAKLADVNISDNNVLRLSLERIFKIKSEVIRYGGDHVSKVELSEQLLDSYPFLKDEYYVSLSRAQVDNRFELLIEAFMKLDSKNLVIISNWKASKYGRRIFDKYHDKHKNIFLVGPIYDLYQLNCLRSNALVYIHSQTRCGSAPSLIEAISLSLPIFSIDAETNRETTCNKALYFSSVSELKEFVSVNGENELEKLARNLDGLKAKFIWKDIAADYLRLF